MNNSVETLLSIYVAWLVVLGVASLVSGMLYSTFRKVTQHSLPETRASATLAYSLLPLCIATLTSVLLYFPMLNAMVLLEHCHDASCSPHAPATGVDTAIASLLLAAIIGLVGGLLWLPLSRLWRYLRRSQLVLQLTQPSLQGNFRVVESDTPLAWCSGLFRPEVYISKGLMRRLNTDELALITAHERSHAMRYDNLAQLCIDWVTRLWPARQRADACKDFRLSAEQSCDRAAVAATATNDTAEQIAVLLSKLSNAADETINGNLQQRLQSLTTASASSDDLANLSPWFIIAVLWLGGAYLSAHGVHIMLEWLFA